jgi:hypothetical protein
MAMFRCPIFNPMQPLAEIDSIAKDDILYLL